MGKKSYRALFQQELLEHQVHNASVQESTAIDSHRKKIVKHTNMQADILRKNK